MKNTKGDLPPLVQDLLRPEAYPHRTDRIRLRQTHVSYLLFTGRWVYKVKKPVDLGFLDFSTLESRRYYCQREVVLNQRISPEVYLGVVPISRESGRSQVDGPGPPVEYAVKMVQLPETGALVQLLRHGGVLGEDMHRIATKIADFHVRAERGSQITVLGNLDTVRQNWEENLQQIGIHVNRCLSQAQFDDLRAYSRAFLKVRAEVFESRAGQDLILDGHGDLHAGNIFLQDGVQIIDCIEFNDRFRCLDPSEEIAFLAMDLDYHARPDLSQLFVSAYREISGDDGVLELLDFFKVYLACVRGKVNSFCIDDEQLSSAQRIRFESEARNYFRLAHAYIRSISSRPGIVLVAGLMGSGKTHISRMLASRWGLTHLSSDIIRKRLAGVRDQGHSYRGYEEGIYSPTFNRLTYDKLLQEAATRLKGGKRSCWMLPSRMRVSADGCTN